MDPNFFFFFASRSGSDITFNITTDRHAGYFLNTVLWIRNYFFSDLDPDPDLGLISDPDSAPNPACLTKVIRLYIRLSYKIFSHQLKFELQII